MSVGVKGEAFAGSVGDYLKQQGFHLSKEYPVEVGFSSIRKKTHRFDFGNDHLIVECKHYSWTQQGHYPSAKISTLNEAMAYFYAAPSSYRKMIFVAKTSKRGARRPETFAEHYLRLYGHFVPDEVEFYEFDHGTLSSKRIDGNNGKSPRVTELPQL